MMQTKTLILKCFAKKENTATVTKPKSMQEKAKNDGRSGFVTSTVSFTESFTSFMISVSVSSFPSTARARKASRPSGVFAIATLLDTMSSKKLFIV
jgi:hypothetical protein